MRIGVIILNDSLTFLHAADVHLDSPFRGLTSLPEAIYDEVKNSTFTTLDHLVHVAIEKNVDFILFVGDVFDEANRSIRAQMKFKEACEKLHAHHIFVYVSYGNHDYTDGTDDVIVYPNNVFVFPPGKVTSTTFVKNGIELANIYGFSYEKRAVTENKVSEYVMIDRDIPYHIATLHGALNEQTDHASYAPFQLSELRATPFHYWALGHVHERTVLSVDPPIVYPGNMQGRHRKERGERGCYYVHMSKEKTTTQFIPLQAVTFEEVAVDVTECASIFDVERAVQREIVPLREKTLLSLTLRNNGTNRFSFTDETIKELLDVVNERLIEQEEWIYIYRYDVYEKQKERVLSDDTFYAELETTFAQLSLEEIVQDVTTHEIGRKFLTNLATEDELIERARSYLLNELGRHEEGE
ncbi:MAG TPA: DNA repair exonuclease [Pseudogracilibacillus sp.]|nr:DNA repair exonuclease [Pseudogracilibacillus sp.]